MGRSRGSSSYSNARRNGRYGAVIFFGLLILGFGIAFLVRGLTFQVADRGPGSVARPFTFIQHGARDNYQYYGAYLHIDSTGRTSKVDDDEGSSEPAYMIVMDNDIPKDNLDAPVPVQHVSVDSADNSLYSFEYEGRTYHLESGRHGELEGAAISLPIGVVLLSGTIGVIFFNRRRSRPGSSERLAANHL